MYIMLVLKGFVIFIMLKKCDLTLKNILNLGFFNRFIFSKSIHNQFHVDSITVISKKWKYEDICSYAGR